MATLKAYADLTRIHFFFAWPLLFLSGLFLSFPRYGGFDWLLVAKAALIGLLGFEAGFVLNDYVDRDLDRRDVEDRLTRYWRLFKTRPLASGSVTAGEARSLFLVLAGAAALLAATLPYPHNLYVLAIQAYSYIVEWFYQIRKRGQGWPLAQLLGRTDFTLFPVAGYLANGHPDAACLLYAAFFYPFAQAHLGVNDLADLRNDEARGMATIPVLYGNGGAALWVAGFTALHLISSFLFQPVAGPGAAYGFPMGALLLAAAGLLIVRSRSPDVALRVLPAYHVTMLIYTVSIIAPFFLQ